MAIVMKFGGTSVGSAERINQACDIILSHLEQRPVVVVSAVGGITDRLIAAANDAAKGSYDLSLITDKHHTILKDLCLDETIVDKELAELKKTYDTIISEKRVSKKMLDVVVSFGERMSAKIVAANLNRRGKTAQALRAYDIGFITDSNFTDAELLPETYDNLKKNPELNKKKIINVVTGFIAKDKDGNITTLGRGGSDFTAAIIGAGIDAEEIQIWTDVDGILSADPRVVKNAISIPTISFAEAAELAYFGAKVLHPKTILPAMQKEIPVVVLNTGNPNHKGTTIVKHVEEDATSNVFAAISSKKNITIIRIVSSRMLNAHGFLAKIFEVFKKHEVVVDMVATSEVSVNVTISNTEKLDNLVKELKRFSKIEIKSERAIICVVGRRMKGVLGITGKILTICGDEGINVEMISQGASQVNFSFVVKNEDADRSVIALHKELIER